MLTVGMVVNFGTGNDEYHIKNSPENLLTKKCTENLQHEVELNDLKINYNEVPSGVGHSNHILLPATPQGRLMALCRGAVLPVGVWWR